MPDVAQTGTRVDPYRAYNFRLEVNGVNEAHFTECSGLGVKVQAIAYREGGTREVVHRLPGHVEYCDVTLRYGLTNSPDMWEWLMKTVAGQVDRRNVSIVMVDNDGVTEVMRWNLLDAWPSEWRGALLNALAQEAAIESMTLVFEQLTRDSTLSPTKGG